MKKEDISWLSRELPDLNIAAYTVNDPSDSTHPPKNKGHEVMIYLTYIIDHYYSNKSPSLPHDIPSSSYSNSVSSSSLLPDVTIFMHAHRWTHHNNALLGFDAVQMLSRLNPQYVLDKGYVNMRCHWSPGCPEHLELRLQASPSPDDRETDEDEIDRETYTDPPAELQELVALPPAWHELFPSFSRPSSAPASTLSSPLETSTTNIAPPRTPPKYLSQPCCAQFAISRNQILSIPLSQYIYYRDWLLRTPLSDYFSGRIWEYLWQYVFLGRGEVCEREDICYCGAFGVCFDDEQHDDNHHREGEDGQGNYHLDNGGDNKDEEHNYATERGRQGYEAFKALVAERDVLKEEMEILKKGAQSSQQQQQPPRNMTNESGNHGITDTDGNERPKDDRKNNDHTGVGDASERSKIAALNEQIKALDQDLDVRKEEALRRGQERQQRQPHQKKMLK